MASAMDVKTESSGINWDNFPAGLRVMVVDDDELCLKLVEAMLQKCSYEVTTFNNATQALEVLRRKTQEFDLVLSDVYMPDIDGFKLLETIGLELDLPVIMMSSNGETTTVLRGVTHGAVDFLIKPVRIEELRNLWQHVVRRRKDIVKDIDSDEHSQDNKEDQAESSKKRKDPGKDTRESMREEDGGAAKKPRVVWSVEMHQQFVNAVNQLGIDKAVPKKILELMNVEGLTRENVASHLQKYRLYLKRVAGVAGSSGRPVKPISGAVNSLVATAAQVNALGAGGHQQLPGAHNPQAAVHAPQQLGPEALANPFAAPGLLPNAQAVGGFPNANLNAMTAAQAAQAAVAAQAANMMANINAMNLGAMNLSRHLPGGAANAGAASMAMQLGMGGMSGPQLGPMAMGLNPATLGLSLPNMQNMNPMAMAQMGQLHLNMVGMNSMNGALMGANPLANPNTQLTPNVNDHLPHSQHPFAPSSTPQPHHQQPPQQLPNPQAAPQHAPTPTPPQPHQQPHHQPPQGVATSIAQELAMMEQGTSFADFPGSAPMPAPAEVPTTGALEGPEFGGVFGETFGAAPGTGGGVDMPIAPKAEPMEDFLSFLLKDGNMHHEA